MDCGAALARHYVAEALRLCQSAQVNDDLRLAQRTLEWIRGRGQVFSLPDVYRFGPPAIRDKETATRMVGILADHGHVESVPGGAEVDGRRRRDVWRLVMDD